MANGGPAATAAVSGRRWFTDAFCDAHSEVVAARLERLAGNDPRAYAAAYRVLATNDLVDSLAQITAPTLVMTGEHDVGSPPHMAQTMQARIRDSRLVVLDGLRHSVLIEAPDRVAAELGPFLTAADPVRT